MVTRHLEHQRDIQCDNIKALTFCRWQSSVCTWSKWKNQPPTFCAEMSYLFLAPGAGSALIPSLGLKITSHCQGQPQSCLFPISSLNIFYLIRFADGWGKLPFFLTSCSPRFPSPHPQYIFCHACLLFLCKKLCMPGERINVTPKNV